MVREAARQEADAPVRRPSLRPHTDLMNAFQLAEKVFNGESVRGASEKILVIFSDMIEQTRRHDFSSENLTEARISQILDIERKAGRLPELRGVKVWVAGATAAGSGSGLPPEKIQRIQQFWLRYFKACSADLTKERYASTLLNFDPGG